MNYKPFAHKLFGGKNRAEILMAICASPEPVPERALPVHSGYNRQEVLKAFEQAGIIVRTEDGRVALDQSFRGAHDLRILGATLAGTSIPSLQPVKGNRSLLQPRLFGRPACTRVLSALAARGDATFEELRCGLSTAKLRRVLTRLRRIGIITWSDRISFAQGLPAREALIATAAACQSESELRDHVPSSEPFARLFGGHDALEVLREIAKRGEMTSADISSMVNGEDYRTLTRTLMARGLIAKADSRYLARFTLAEQVAQSSALALIGTQAPTRARSLHGIRVFGVGWTPILKAIAMGPSTARDISQKTGILHKTVCAQAGLLVRCGVLKRFADTYRFAEFPEARAVIEFLRALPA